MVICYGILGFFADIALVANNFLMIGILSALGATLTLPGIAGIVLTMGMAVDANVLIYERMREEARSGRSTIVAFDQGFRRAFATIIDSHLTALIAAIALFWLGAGPIRGFAVTLAIGIICTLFTSYLVTRLIVSWWIHTARPKTVPL
jgi:protein-export membrane protein SecD